MTPTIASTMLATVVMVTVWMGSVKAGGGEASCKVDKIQTMKDFDPAKMKGTWYITYRSHKPPGLENVGLAQYTVLPQGKSRIIPFNYTLVTKDGVCTVISKEFVVDAEDPAKWTADLGGNIVQRVYFLATDYDSVSTAYDETAIDGKVIPPRTAVNIGVRGPMQTPNMEIIGPALERFCGRKAKSLDFFDYFNPATVPACV